MVKKAAEHLAEHFDSVQVFVTRQEEGSTFHVAMGAGNYFARVGQVREWISMERAKAVNDLSKNDE